jgi:hypothetical protein
MLEKAEMVLDTAVISNRVVEEKSVIVTRCLSLYVLQLLRSLN